ncbi:MAG: hypothetical protein RLZZ532_772 [Cyanobacteriota bacterium]|jgi:hypothetical protein
MVLVDSFQNQRSHCKIKTDEYYFSLVHPNTQVGLTASASVETGFL